MSPTGHLHRQPAHPALSKIPIWKRTCATSGSFHNCILERTCAPPGSFQNWILERTCTRNCISHPCNTTNAMPLAPDGLIRTTRRRQGQRQRPAAIHRTDGKRKSNFKSKGVTKSNFVTSRKFGNQPEVFRHCEVRSNLMLHNT